MTERYAQPEFLWLICPLLLYWLGRLALIAHRRMMKSEDPLTFVLRDRISWLVCLCVLAAFVAAL